jgi:tRNA (mo5U34)-methyltransferase
MEGQTGGPLTDAGVSPDEARRLVASNPVWYHTIEVAPGVVTPGWFDLRPIVDKMPWPDVRGKRCLDVGPYDGFLSFELERRGAAEVVAADIGDASEWDWPLHLRRSGPAAARAQNGGKTGGGFEIARELLGSGVQRVELSIYDLSPDTIGTFDVVVCGSLLLHLKNPIGALEAIRSVCDGKFLSAEQIDLPLTLLNRNRAAARLRGGDRCQWWIPNSHGHRVMVSAGGFEVLERTKPYAISLGEAHAHYGASPRLRHRVSRGVRKLAAGSNGAVHAALLARPAAIDK